MSTDVPETTTLAVETLSLDEAATVLGVKRSTLYTYTRAGLIPGTIKIGRVTRISRSALDRILADGLEVVQQQERRKLRAVRRQAAAGYRR